MEQGAGDGGQDTGEGEQDRQKINAQGDKNILLNLKHGFTSHIEQIRQPLEIILDQYGVSSLYRHITADAAHANPRLSAA